MKTKTYYAIFKMFAGDADYWDGPFKTREKAEKKFRTTYRNEIGRQDFQVAKIVTTFLRTK